MSKKSYRNGFSKMSAACGMDAVRLIQILGNKREKRAGIKETLSEAIEKAKNWYNNDLTDDQRTLALGLAGLGGGSLLGAGLGKLTGLGAGKGAIGGGLLGALGGTGYGMYSKKNNELQSALAANEEQKKRIAEHEKSIGGLNRQVGDLVDSLDEANTNLQQRTVELSAANAGMADKEKLIKKIQDELSGKDKTIAGLRAKFRKQTENMSDEDLQKMVDYYKAVGQMRVNGRIGSNVDNIVNSLRQSAPEFTQEELKKYMEYVQAGISPIKASMKVMRERGHK